MQNLWSAVDRLRRNSHWRFKIIPSTNTVNLHTVMSCYISFSLTAFSCSSTPQYACYTVTFRDTTLVTSPLDEWSVRHSHLYVKTHNTHNRQTSMPPWDSIPQIQQHIAHSPRLRPYSQWDCPSYSLCAVYKQILGLIFSTVFFIYFLINGKPSESKRLFIYYPLDVYKESEPQLMYSSHSISVASYRQQCPPCRPVHKARSTDPHFPRHYICYLCRKVSRRWVESFLRS